LDQLETFGFNRLDSDNKEILLYFFVIQNILLCLKYFLELSVPQISKWIKEKIQKEEKAKIEAEKIKTNLLNRIFKQKKAIKETGVVNSGDNQINEEEDNPVGEMIAKEGGMKIDLRDKNFQKRGNCSSVGYRDEIYDFIVEPEAESHYFFFDNKGTLSGIKKNELMFLEEENVEFRIVCKY
jgi:hypothetical protein